jgi:D-lactate dehydrogenase
MDIFFYEAFEEEAAELKRLLGKEFVYALDARTIQDVNHVEPPSRLISIRTQSTIPVEWADKIDGVLSRSTGYDHLIAYRKRITKKLPCGYLDEYASRAVAEQALLLSLSLLRKLPQQMKQFQAFERDGLTGLECLGRNLLVVGVGRIGTEIEAIARGMGFTTRGVDIVPNKAHVAYVPREEGIKWADVIVCSMNLTAENRGYFSDELLRKARRGCVFVNIARGELSPLEGLARLSEEGHLGGVGLDVYEDESALATLLRNPAMKADAALLSLNRLARCPNVILTPHNAFNTIEAVRRKSEMSVQQVRHFLQHKDFLWKLD